VVMIAAYGVKRSEYYDMIQNEVTMHDLLV
jgi:hypothetical protein